MPTKLPDFIENRLFLILYFVCTKKLGLKIILSYDSKCATSDIIVHWEIHIHKNGCFHSFSVNIILSRDLSESGGGGRVVRWWWVNFQCRGVLLIWIIVGQGPTALAVGAGGGGLDIFSLIYHFVFFFPPLSGRRPDID